MLSKKWLYAVFFSLSSQFSYTQNRTIYLGPLADSLFASDLIVETNPPDWATPKTLFRFFDYQTFHHDPTDQSRKENTNRDGIVLTAKSTENLLIKAGANFGKKDDTCFITYDAEVEKITTGRSAAVSILNLFSKKSDKSPQEDPSSHIRHIAIKGKILLNDEAVNFEYSNNLNKDYLLAEIAGKVWFGGDSLLLQPVKDYLTRKGKQKKGYAGYKLAKGETIYGAVDPFARSTNVIFINKTISDKEKLLIAGYLFIVNCYLQNPPPFVDMTPR